METDSAGIITTHIKHHIMSIFEHDNYDRDYERYQDWKINQEEEDSYYEGHNLAAEYEYDLQRERELDERRASQYMEETTGERCVREAEKDVRQLAQITVDGVYRYEIEWLPETHEIQVEYDQYLDGSPMYYWYPDTMGTTTVLSRLLRVPEEKIDITDLVFFTKDDILTAFRFEERQFMQNTWGDYAEDNMVMQFNVKVTKDENTIVLPPGKMCENKCYDGACDGTNCEFKPQQPARLHGIDGTQCDCSDCTLDHGYCSCGCGGDFWKHTEWLEERAVEQQAFVHETAEPLGGTLAEYMEDYMSEPESPKPTLVIEDNESETSTWEKEDRIWSDFKLAMGAAFMALFMGMYICRTLGC